LIIKTSGLVFSCTDISEKDGLLTIFTQSEGLLRVFAKGVKNPKNQNAKGALVFAYSEFVLYKNKDNYVLSECSLKKLFFDLKNDIKKFALAEYFCDLCMELSCTAECADSVLTLLLNSINFLCNGEVEEKRLKAIFEMRLLCMVGYAPNIICSHIESEKKFFWSFEEGIIFCQKCREKKDDSHFVYFQKGVMLCLLHVFYSVLKKAFFFEVSEEISTELSEICEKYILFCLEKLPQVLKIYKDICKNLERTF
jgi:DNA repair protein RecO (recombination protein O)